MNGRKNKRARACDIPQKVRQIVWERDNGACVYCGSTQSCLPSCHFVSRKNGGKGIPENIVTLCTGFGNGCHYLYDSGTKEQREAIGQKIREYLQSQYPDWNENRLIYRKYG